MLGLVGKRGEASRGGYLLRGGWKTIFCFVFLFFKIVLKLLQQLHPCTGRLLWDQRMEHPAALLVKGREGPHQQNIEQAPLLIPPLLPCHPYLSLGDAHSLTSQEKEWQDKPPSASLQWRPLVLFSLFMMLLLFWLLMLLLCCEV